MLVGGSTKSSSPPYPYIFKWNSPNQTLPILTHQEYFFLHSSDRDYFFRQKSAREYFFLKYACPTPGYQMVAALHEDWVTLCDLEPQ